VPLDTEHEFKEIHKIIKYSNKSFLMRKDAIDYERFKTVLLKKPTMIHISCHGSYIKENGKNLYYLALEEKENGILNQFNEHKIKRLLG
jgi:CHAT domain-containing protein